MSLFVALSWRTTHAQFTDATSSAGVGGVTGTYAVSWGDYNNDGYPDLVVGINGSPGVLFVNDGDGTFSPGPAIGTGSRAAAWGDYDNDGDLDLLISLEYGYLYRNNGDGTFTLLGGASIGLTGTTNLGSVGWIDHNEDGLLDIWAPSGASGGNRIFQNDGDGTFTDQGSDALGLTPSSNGETTVVADYDGDGSTDILHRFTSVALWHSDGDGSFTNVTAVAGISLSGDGGGYNGTAFGDYDNDGDLDFYGGQTGTNKLYRNNGDGTFTDLAAAAGVSAGSLTTRGVAWGDYDNDGDLDLYVAHSNGTNNLFRNNGDGTFTDVAAATGVDDSGASYGVSFADADLDGDLDLFVGDDGSASKFFRNDLNDSNFLKVKVTGAGSGFSPRDGTGSRVELWDGDGSTLLAVREITGGEGYGCQRPHIAHFGLDPSQTYTVKVRFTGGTESARSGVIPQAESITVGSTVLSNTIEVSEGAGVSIVESGGSTSVAEGGPTSDTYTVMLDARPAANVTITVDPDNQTDVGSGVGMAIDLTFTDADWDQPQTVTVTAEDDAIAEGMHSSTITHTASSTDGNYDGIAVADVTANVTDDDSAGVTVSESNGSTDVAEAGPTSDTYTIALDSQPTANVTVVATPDGQTDLGAGAGAAIALTFTDADWDQPQTVTVTAVDDAVAEGAHTSNIAHTATSTDGNYDGIAIADVTASVTDDDVAGVILTESDGSTDVAETGPTSDVYTLLLSSKPMADVTITATPDAQMDLGGGPGAEMSFTFAATDWQVERVVVVTATDDGLAEGPHSSRVRHSASSAAESYDGVAIPDVVVNISDNDSAGVTVTESAGSTSVDEAGPTSDTYTIALASPPMANVTVTAVPDGQIDLGAGPGQAISSVYTPADWGVPRTVVVTALDDEAEEGSHASTIIHTSSSTDESYDDIAVAAVTVDIADNDGASVTVAESAGSTEVSEVGPTSDAYWIVLNSRPTGDVTIIATADDQVDLGAGPGEEIRLAFTSGNWDMPRTVVVTAAQDDAVEDTHVSTIVHTVIGDASEYDGIAVPSVEVIIADAGSGMDDPNGQTVVGGATDVSGPGAPADYQWICCGYGIPPAYLVLLVWLCRTNSRSTRVRRDS